uniref:Uncharacterized protein n=1 Tax=Lutzomyia longipalpis TaxID=7200 RepID=A0A7G3B766_LUTLO
MNFALSSAELLRNVLLVLFPQTRAFYSIPKLQLLPKRYSMVYIIFFSLIILMHKINRNATQNQLFFSANSRRCLKSANFKTKSLLDNFNFIISLAVNLLKHMQILLSFAVELLRNFELNNFGVNLCQLFFSKLWIVQDFISLLSSVKFLKLMGFYCTQVDLKIFYS